MPNRRIMISVEMRGCVAKAIYTVLRFWNHEVMQQLEGVLEQIRSTIALSPNPSPTSGRGE